MSATKNIYQRLLEVQKTARAPREISGKFGKARSAEQIEEAYKPVCIANGLYLYTSDEIKQVGDRNYVEATATVVNVDNPEEKHSAKAFAWENEVEMSKSGFAILDTSQVTGKTGSYAKKYALQNLFTIDDTKDADQDDPNKEDGASTGKPATVIQLKLIKSLAKDLGIDEETVKNRLTTIKTTAQASEAIANLKTMKEESHEDQSQD